jgi:hypothetical protein
VSDARPDPPADPPVRHRRMAWCHRWVLAGAIAGLLLGWLLDFRLGAPTQLVAQLSVDTDVICRVATRSAEEEGNRVRRMRLVPEILQYRFDLGGTRNRGRISIGMRAKEGAVVRVQSLAIEKPGRATRHWDLAALAAQPDALEGGVFVPSEEGGVNIRFENYRCTLRLPYALERRPGTSLAEWLAVLRSALLWATAGAVASLCFARVRRMAPPADRVPTALVAALAAASALVAAMAFASPFNAHPDEIWHFSAAGYYLSESAPPAAHDPLAAPSFSAFRFSYLATRDLVYPVLGFWMRTLAWWNNGGTFLHVLARLLPVLLFAGMAWWFARRGTTLFAGALLLSGQVWITFSTINSEFLPLAAGLLLGCALTAPGGSLDRWLRGEPGTGALPAILCATGLVLLLFAKPNFRACFGFFILVLALRPWLPSSSARPATRTALLRLATLALCVAFAWGLGSAFYALRPKSMAAGANPNRHHVETTEEKENRIRSVDNLRAKGVGLREFLTERGWVDRTFSSLFGGYGWMRIWHSRPFYALLWSAAATLAACVAWAAVRSRSAALMLVTAAAFAACAAVTAAAAHWSWTVSFQPQGRYLLPILPILAANAQLCRGFLPLRTMRVAAGILFAGALYSFAFNALVYIGRVDITGFL